MTFAMTRSNGVCLTHFCPFYVLEICISQPWRSRLETGWVTSHENPAARTPTFFSLVFFIICFCFIILVYLKCFALSDFSSGHFRYGGHVTQETIQSGHSQIELI